MLFLKTLEEKTKQLSNDTSATDSLKQQLDTTKSSLDEKENKISTLEANLKEEQQKAEVNIRKIV